MAPLRDITKDPHRADTLQHWARLSVEAGQFEEAAKALRWAIKISPLDPISHWYEGNVNQVRDLLPAALRSFECSLVLQPDFCEGWHNHGVVRTGLQQWENALRSYQRALRLGHEVPETLNQLGSTLKSLGRPDLALEYFARGLQQNSRSSDLLFNQGNCFNDLGFFQQAVASFSRAACLAPDDASIWNAHSNVNLTLARSETALRDSDRALRIKPGYAEALYSRGNALQEIGDFAAALKAYESAWQINADLDYLLGAVIRMKSATCDWDGLDIYLKHADEALRLGRRAVSPFVAMMSFDAPFLHRLSAETFAQPLKRPTWNNAPLPTVSNAGETIHIAYISADFFEHATSYLIVGVLELHSRQKFKITALSYGAAKVDPMRERIIGAVDQFLDVSTKSDSEIAELCRTLRVDVAVDLKGYTRGCRPGIFGYGCAPIQINWLGFAGTLGSDRYDYIIADKQIIETTDTHHYIEKIIWLPHTYQPNDRKRLLAGEVPNRARYGLPEGSTFVFCCFNNNYKIRPETFHCWMRILEQVPTSVLWLLEDNPTASFRLQREAERCGVNASRILMAPRMPQAEHLKRHRCADLFLDTWPCNAHTTASDALSMGLPVLTLRGASFASRVASSLLTACDLSELITNDLSQYESRAVELALNPLQMISIRERLDLARDTSPFFDTSQFVNDLERAYEHVTVEKRAGQPTRDVLLGIIDI